MRCHPPAVWSTRALGVRSRRRSAGIARPRDSQPETVTTFGNPQYRASTYGGVAEPRGEHRRNSYVQEITGPLLKKPRPRRRRGSRTLLGVSAQRAQAGPKAERKKVSSCRHDAVELRPDRRPKAGLAPIAELGGAGTYCANRRVSHRRPSAKTGTTRGQTLIDPALPKT